MPQDTGNNYSGRPDQNRPYIRDRHEDFQLVDVAEILRNPDQSKIMSEPPILPKGGEVYLYRPNTSDKRVRDQYWWVNRGNNFHSKGQKRPSIMKTYFSLKDRSGGRKSDCLNGFRRHLYRLADARDEDVIIFVHYLGDETLHKPMPHGNTKDWWYKESSASSRDSTTKKPEVPVSAALEFPGVNATTVGTGQGRIIAGYSTMVGSKQGSVSVEARAPTNVLNPGVSLGDKIQHILDNNRKRPIPSWNSNNKMANNKGGNDPRFLHNNSSPASKKIKVNSAPNVQVLPMSRTGQHDVKPPIRTYLHQSMSSPVVSRRIRMSTPVSSIGQQSRTQRVFNLARQQLKPVSLIKNTNSPQLAARTQEQRQQQMKMRHLGNSLPSVTKTRMPTNSQVILHEALQQEPGNRNYVSQSDQTLNRGQDMSENSLPRHSNYILQDSQPVTSANSSFQNSSYSENPVSGNNSTLPMDYEKLFEEASKLPRMGCNVFVLVSYPGCKPAYWGTEKYVKKFENSDCLLPFSASGCLSIKMRSSPDKQNLLANNLDHSQPMQQQLDELDSSGTNPNLNFVVKEESRKNDEEEELVVVQGIVKQELPETEDDPPFVDNNHRRMEVMTQRLDNSLAGRTDPQSIKNSFKRNRQYQKQLDTSNLYSGGMNSYDFSADTRNRLSNRSTLRDKEVTNFYDQAHAYRDGTTVDTGGGSGQSSSMDHERVSADESRLPAEIEPSGVLIKIEPQTDDYGDINNLVYTEYG